MMATSTFPPETTLPPPALHQPTHQQPCSDISQAASVLDPPKAVIYNKDGTQCMHIVKKESVDVPSNGTPCQSQITAPTSNCSAAKAVSDPPMGTGRKKKKKKSKKKGGATSHSQIPPPEYDDDDEDAEFYQEIVQPLPPPPPLSHSTKSSRTPAFASTKAPCVTNPKESYTDCISGPTATDAKRKKKKKKKTPIAEPPSQLTHSRNDRTASANEPPTGGNSGKVVPNANRSQNKTTTSYPTNAQTNGRSMLPPDDGFWQDKNCEERAKIREFWLQMGESERRELVQVEKEAVLRKMKEQQKQSCSCAICGRKRNAIEEELEVLYDAYYEELETYANQHQNQLLPPSAQYRANASLPLASNDVSPFGPPLTHPISQQHQHHRRNLNAPPHEVIRSQHCQLHSQPGQPRGTISDDEFEGSDYEDDEGEEEEDEDDEEEDEDEEDDEEEDDEEDEDDESFDDEEEEEDVSDDGGERTKSTRTGRRGIPSKNSPNTTHHPSTNGGGGGGGGGYFNFGNSLTVKGGILTVADDLLKNDSEKFLEMMERLAERRMRRDEEIAMEREALAAGNGPNGASPYQDEYDDDDDDEEEDDEEFEDEAEEDSMTEEQRLEEGRRMFQLFAARMFEQRVLTAYREKVAQERQQRLLDELEEETRLKQQREDAKNKIKEKKKDKKRALRQQKEEERLAKEAAKLAEETAQREERERKAEAERKRKEDERLRSEKERKQKDEERARKEEEKRRRTKERENKERQEREVKEKEREEKEKCERKEREEQTAKEERERERRAQEEKEQREREDSEKGFTPVARSDRRRSSASDRHQHLLQQAQAQAQAQAQPRAPHPLPLPPPLSQRLPPSIPRSAVSTVRDAHHHGLPPPPPKNVHMHHRERKRDQPSPSTTSPPVALAPSLTTHAVSASLFAHSPTSTNCQPNASSNPGSRPVLPGPQSSPLVQKPSVSSDAQQPSAQPPVASASVNVSQSLFSDPTSSRQGAKPSPQVSPVPIESNSKRPSSANGMSAPGPIGRPTGGSMLTGSGTVFGGNLCNGTTGSLSLSASPTRGLFLGGGQGLGVNVTGGPPVSPPRSNSIPQGGGSFRVSGDPIRPPTSKAIMRPAPIGRPRGGFEATATCPSPTKGLGSLDIFDPPTSPPPQGPPGFGMYGGSRDPGTTSTTSPTTPSDQAPKPSASTIPGGSNFTVPTIPSMPCNPTVSTATPSSSAAAAAAAGAGSLFSSPSFFSGPPAPLHHDHEHDHPHPHHPLYQATTAASHNPHSIGPPLSQPSQDISMHHPHSFLPSFLSHPGMPFLSSQSQPPPPHSQPLQQAPPPQSQAQSQSQQLSHDASQEAPRQTIRPPHTHPQGLAHNLSIASSPFVSSTAGLWGPVGGFGMGPGLLRGGGFLGGIGTNQGGSEGLNPMMQGGNSSGTGVGAVGESRRSGGMGFEKTLWH